MLRLSEYLKAGGLLVKGDEIGHEYSNSTSFVKDNDHAERLHLSTSDKILIKSFAFRDNNGKQPVPDDFPVVINMRLAGYDRAAALNVCWNKSHECCVILWAPDYSKLLEQQNEYDKQQEKPIEEIMINAKEGKMRYFTYGQKIYIKNHDKREFKFACYHIDGDSILFMFDDGYGHVGIDNVSATPFKDELEIAQEEQIEILVDKWSHWFPSTENAADFFKVLQGSGDLSEISLPRED